MLVDSKKVCYRWETYLKELLNEKSGTTNIDNIPKIEGPIQAITEDEVKEAVKSLKNKKAPGPTGLSADIIKAAGQTAVRTLLNIFHKIWDTEELPEDFSKSLTIPIYKGKGDPLACSSYRGIRLLEHSMKMLEKILESRLRKIVVISEVQYGFMQSRSTVDPIFILRQMQEKYMEKKKPLHHLFVDLEKAFDRVPRETIVWALRRQMIPEKLIRLVMLTYTASRTTIRSKLGDSGEIDITVGVHQGSVLSPLLFITIMEEATKDIRDGTPMELLYADDLVLTATNADQLTCKFQRWHESFLKSGMVVNANKTKYLISGETAPKSKKGKFPCAVCMVGVGSNSIVCKKCNQWCHKRCSGIRHSLSAMEDQFECPKCKAEQATTSDETEVQHLRSGELKFEKVHNFTYLGDVVQSEGGIEASVRSRIRATWCKWKDIASILMQKNIALSSRSQLFKSCVRPVLLYASETWPVTQTIENLIRRTEMKMLRWMLHLRLTDRVSNDEILRRLNLEDISEALRKNRLRWFGHTERSKDPNIVAVKHLTVEGKLPRGRPKTTWFKTIEKDLEAKSLHQEDAQDRIRWRHSINRQTPNGNNDVKRDE